MHRDGAKVSMFQLYMADDEETGAVLLLGFPRSYECIEVPRHTAIDLYGVDESKAQDEMGLCRSGFPFTHCQGP